MKIYTETRQQVAVRAYLRLRAEGCIDKDGAVLRMPARNCRSGRDRDAPPVPAILERIPVLLLLVVEREHALLGIEDTVDARQMTIGPNGRELPASEAKLTSTDCSMSKREKRPCFVAQR